MAEPVSQTFLCGDVTELVDLDRIPAIQECHVGEAAGEQWDQPGLHDGTDRVDHRGGMGDETDDAQFVTEVP